MLRDKVWGATRSLLPLVIGARNGKRWVERRALLSCSSFASAVILLAVKLPNSLVRLPVKLPKLLVPKFLFLHVYMF